MVGNQWRQPTFLFIGPDKTGSSWLYEILKAHPDCFVPKIKDLYFFDRYFDRGMDWYLQFFAEADAQATAVGELSHDYLYSPDAAQRIAQELPNVRLITCLRQPVDRTFSHYLYLVSSGLTTLPFGEAFDQFSELTNNSLYAKHLRVYFDLFRSEQIKVLWFDDLKRDPRDFADQMFEFLGVETPENLAYEQQVLPASRPRSVGLARLAKLGANLSRNLGLASVVGAVKQQSWVRGMLYEPYGKDEKPVLEPEMRARLQSLFEPDILALERLLNADLAHWRGSREAESR